MRALVVVSDFGYSTVYSRLLDWDN